MIEFLKEVYAVMWSDLRFMRHHFLNIFIMSIMSPLLYLLAFGYGMGRGMTYEDIPYVAFVVPGIVALTTLSTSFSSTSTRINVQRLYYYSFDEMMMSPLRNSAIIIGKSMMGVIRGSISGGIILLIGLYITPDLHLTPLLIASILISCFTFSFLGIMAALLAKSHQSISTFSSLIILPMTFLCGTFFSVSLMPGAFQFLLYLLPLTHASICIRASALDWVFPWTSLLILLAFCASFFLINVYILKTKM
ncbi:MAG: ABC transporter permease [Euryarchaeota archaeon]|nr:ABC transporter permease [Euryarchaeota archaeon]